ncbi:MAG TPA: MarR family transcriptional regulator [Stellaceae bacterium]|nr:MarR family transcriptional regulator [Stellaceae bacterium]
MIDYDFEQSFGYVLHDTARLLGKRFDQRARAFGLTRAQCQVLVQLVKHEGINQAGLAELLELEPISLARLIDRMEQAGWVQRRADPTDRRARLLYITAKAKPIFERIVELGRAIRLDALSCLSAAERQELLDLMVRVRRNLSEKGFGAAERLTVTAGAK